MSDAVDFQWLLFEYHVTDVIDIAEAKGAILTGKDIGAVLDIASDIILRNSLSSRCTLVMMQRPTDEAIGQVIDSALGVDFSYSVLDEIGDNLVKVAALHRWRVPTGAPALDPAWYQPAIRQALLLVLRDGLRAVMSRLDWSRAYHLTRHSSGHVTAVPVRGGSDA